MINIAGLDHALNRDACVERMIDLHSRVAGPSLPFDDSEGNTIELKGPGQAAA